MTARRILGPGPQAAPIQAAQADLFVGLPGVRLPDLDEVSFPAAKPPTAVQLGLQAPTD
ncbi:hypothetical protein [Streptomyces sp. bgisy060]|uniref:hypothetical protein n=1 Tax=Streptomyces sp. bgisy060 TaxID=3413775 RepID=UPI003EC034BC